MTQAAIKQAASKQPLKTTVRKSSTKKSAGNSKPGGPSTAKTVKKHSECSRPKEFAGKKKSVTKKAAAEPTGKAKTSEKKPRAKQGANKKKAASKKAATSEPKVKKRVTKKKAAAKKEASNAKTMKPVFESAMPLQEVLAFVCGANPPTPLVSAQSPSPRRPSTVKRLMFSPKEAAPFPEPLDHDIENYVLE